ncbi:glycoside hydrolase family 2 TIM barrel-domain containing protein [Xylanibacter muris]|uniref:Glycoside hydrolase family 2 protein n=1 Tax=Xylanibacter muris TaxID=2736290 RepID=A0ABX2AM62_9BACT|nr:glycoside hydrolase family 2 TIM barrel-domain containing protein [Xylanibacter muris]NPD92318.1 glycoside hydrolase family 2 protein [Xylanibacter muris]
MKKISLIFSALMAFLTVSADDARIVRTMNFDWRFHAGDVAGCEVPGFNDKGWQSVDVPHDFQISQPWVPPAKDEKADNSDAASNVKSRLSSRGFKEMGIGWYRKSFTPDASWKGKRIVLDFEGIMLVGDVYLNGERIGGTEYGYVGFEIDITKKLKFSQENVIAVKANTQKPENSRWYTGGGLFRDVNIIVTDPQMYFTRHPLYITTPVVEAGKASVKVQAEIACYLRTNKLKVNTKIIDALGNAVYDVTKDIDFNRGQKINEHPIDSITISNPHLWSCEDPYLYKAQITLLRPDGSVADMVTENFGVRKIEYSPEFGFKLNGKKVIMKGIANHHTLGALGAAVYPRAIEKRLQMLKEFGFNHVRTSHNPYSKSFLDLCDKYGFLVVDELYDKWLTKFAGGRTAWENIWQYDVPEFVKRDRNHPSVVMWSLGNELQTYWDLPYADWGVTAYRLQKVLLNRYDTTRPVTVAMHPRGRNLKTDSLPAPLVLETDIAAYNYRYMYFPGDSKRFPHLMFYQSEANTAAMGPNYYEMDLDKVIGLAYWGMIDYLGESHGWPAKGWTQGVFDISLEPKPIAYFLRSIFNENEPIVHIGIIDKDDNTVWNDVKVGTQTMSDHWNRKEGSKMSLYTYTNADEVELLVNGKTIGVRKNDRNNPKVRNKIRWDNVAYQKGNIEAVARKGGKVVARHKIETTGEAKRLAAVADNKDWKADGMDLQHVRVCAVDSKGRRVQTSDNKIRFEVSGPAEIVGVINGNLASDELTVGNSRSLYKGTATVILRSKKEAGKVTLTASADGLKTSKTVMLSVAE